MSGIAVFALERAAEYLNAAVTLQTAAPDAPAGSPIIGSLLLPFVLIIGVFYFVMWRPEGKRLKEHQAMLSALKKGDEVILMGGIYGKVHEVSGKQVVLEIANDVKIRVVPEAISGLVPPAKQPKDS